MRDQHWALCGAAAGDNPENDAARIEQLLKLGAHAFTDPAAGAGEHAEDKGMATEDIDQVCSYPHLVQPIPEPPFGGGRINWLIKQDISGHPAYAVPKSTMNYAACCTFVCQVQVVDKRLCQAAISSTAAA